MTMAVNGSRLPSSLSGQYRLHGPLAMRHRARLIGSGEDLVIFAHGFGTDQSAWDPLLAHLPERFSALVYDLPGAGPLLPPDFNPDHYRSHAPFADELLALMDEVGIERAFFVGHSVSGMIGALAAIEEPRRFRKLALLSASPRYLDAPGYHGGFDRQDLAALFEAMAANYQAWVAGFAPLAVGADVPQAVDEFAAGLLAMRPDITLRMARMIFESDVRDILPLLRVPTVLIHAHADIAVPEQVAHYLHAHVSGSQLVWIDVTGHLPHLSAPRHVAAALMSQLHD
jgi:pimeloyl-ACP methyl ester carboxylesterase